MSLLHSKSLFVGPHDSQHRKKYLDRRILASLDYQVRLPLRSPDTLPIGSCLDETIERIANLLKKPEVSISTYDTAWVAMVPSQNSAKDPFFRGSLNWLLENQCPDGSWALPHHHDLLRKDVLSSTLACVLALKKWGVAPEQMERGAHFIESSFASAFDDRQWSPIGFDIIFPAMIEYARDFSLKLDLEPTSLNALFSKRDLELKRYQTQHVGREASIVYLAEGMWKSLDWNKFMQYQQKNGSFFNCPSTTSAAYIGFPNASCLNYLQSVVNKFGNAVPVFYPIDIQLKLSTVDSLEKLGISRYFRKEIQDVLDETYGLWLQGSEEILTDDLACALAFRLLRMNEYKITSDHIVNAIKRFFDGNASDMNTALELYKASEVILYRDEHELENQNSRLRRLLEQKISAGPVESIKLQRNIDQEVNHAIKYPFFAILDGVKRKTSIEHFNSDCTRILKTSYYSPNFATKEFLFLSQQDFNKCQELHRNELEELERWEVDNRLDDLKFARQKCVYSYFTAAASMFSPELSNSRLSWAKNTILVFIVDDFFDVEGSIEELKELIHLVERWDVDVETQFSSKSVRIIFLALKQTLDELCEKAYMKQGQRVTDHVIQMWLDMLYSKLKEAKWTRSKLTPSIEEYMANATTSIGIGPLVTPGFYLLEPKVSKGTVHHHPEYDNLFRLTSICSRLLNDIQSGEREMKEGKLDAIAWYSTGETTNKEASIERMKRSIEKHRRELLEIVMQKSVIPKALKDVFFHVLKMMQFFYIEDDGFDSEEMLKLVKQVIYEPVGSVV